MNKKNIKRGILFISGAGALLLIGLGIFFLIRPVRPPNLLIVTMDTTRADRIGCYGYDKIRTPNIDAVAKEGVLFEEAFSVQPVTLPSHASIFTGKYPFSHGVRDNNIYRLAEDNLTLAEILMQKDYLTTAFLSSYILHKRFGLHQGFSFYNDRFINPRQKGRLPVERRASEVSFLASEWLNAVDDDLEKKPFFLWLHYYDPHAGYDPPHPYKTAYPDPYDGEIAYMDDWMGYFFDELKQRGLWDNTIVVLVADHGESLGQHKENTHGLFIYRPTTRVPLIIRYPESLPRGMRIKERVATVDIMPTLLDLLDINVDAKFDGKSLLSLVRGKEKQPDRAIYSEVFIPKSFGWSELKGIRKNEWFFIEAPRPELYQIGEGEPASENLMQNQPQIADTLRNRLLTMLANTDTSKVEHVVADEEMVQRLQALGYFVGGGENAVEDEAGGLQSDPKDKIGLFNLYQLANSLIAKEAYGPAASILETIVEKDPNNQRFRMELGDAYVKLEKYQEAEKHLKYNLSRNAEDSRSHYLLGLCYENWGKPDMALKEYREAVALNPDHFLAHFHRGLIHIESGRWDMAERAFNETRRLKPRNPTVLNNLGYIAIKGRKDFDGGIGMILEALKNAPGDPTVLGSLGSAYANAGDYEKAAKYLNAALALVPDDRRFINVLKEVYGKTGEQGKLSQLQERERLIEE